MNACMKDLKSLTYLATLKTRKIRRICGATRSIVKLPVDNKNTAISTMLLKTTPKSNTFHLE